MGRDVNNVFINIIKKGGTSPYMSLVKVKEFESHGRIQKEIFG
jgi:hypothetical protein